MYYKQSDAVQVIRSVCTLLLQYIKSAAASASAQSVNEHSKSIVILLTWTCYYGKKTSGKSYGLVSYVEGKLRCSPSEVAGCWLAYMCKVVQHNFEIRGDAIAEALLGRHTANSLECLNPRGTQIHKIAIPCNRVGYTSFHSRS